MVIVCIIRNTGHKKLQSCIESSMHRRLYRTFQTYSQMHTECWSLMLSNHSLPTCMYYPHLNKVTGSLLQWEPSPDPSSFWNWQYIGSVLLSPYLWIRIISMELVPKTSGQELKLCSSILSLFKSSILLDAAADILHLTEHSLLWFQNTLNVCLMS